MTWIEKVLYQNECVRVEEVWKEHARRFLWSLQEESGEFRLGDYRELREHPPDVPFPVWVFGRIGSWKTRTHNTQPQRGSEFSPLKTHL